MKQLLFICTGVLLFGLIACTEQDTPGVQTLNLKKIAAKQSENTLMTDSKIFAGKVMQISPEDGNQGIVIWEKGDRQDWSKGNYLVFEIYGDNEFSGVITIEFYKETKGVEPEKIVLQSGEITEVSEERPSYR